MNAHAVDQWLDEHRPDLTYWEHTGPTVTAFHDSPVRLRMLRAPNQTGKTYAGAWEGNRYSLARPGSVGCVLVADLDNHYSEICGKIWSVIARGELDGATKYVHGKGFYRHGRRGIGYRNGSRWVFRTGKGEVMALAGATFDWLWVDEVPQQAHFWEALRGVATNTAPVWLTFTPIGRPADWLRKAVEGDPETGEEPEAEWVQFVPSLTADECRWRTPESIQQQIDLTSPWERPQRIHGAWEGPTEGRRFSGMSAASIVPAVPSGEYHIAVTMDHGEGVGKQHALLLMWDSQRIVVADEYVNDHASVPTEDSRGILAVLQRNGVGLLEVDRWTGDVNSAGKLGAGASVNEEMERAIKQLTGVQVRIHKPSKGKGSVEYGERLLNHALESGELLIVERCRRLRRSLTHYTGKEEDLKHPIDALRYGAQPIMLDRRRATFSRWYIQQGGR